MSTPSEVTRDHKSMTLPGGPRKHKSKKHYLRNILITLLLIAAIVLWQLIPIIHGLGTVQQALTHAEGIRAVFAAILSSIYEKVQHVALPLFKRL